MNFEIRIGENYKIKRDSLQYILQKRSAARLPGITAEGKPIIAKEETWVNLWYNRNIATLIAEAFRLQNEIMCDVQDLDAFALVEIKKFVRTITVPKYERNENGIEEEF